jgi:predicted ribosome quality control (RQC) complex YloA/Tae2 family protein
MPYDGLMLKAVVKELQPFCGQRIDKIFQPENDEIQIQFRSKDKRRLKFSINSSMPYMTMTQIRKQNPNSPPNFLILMRKYLLGAIMIRIEQFGMDRILKLYFEGHNELGDPTELRLIFELMGRHSNLILTDGDDLIIDSLKRVPPFMSQVRQILPNLQYEILPGKQKNLDELNFPQFCDLMQSNEMALKKCLQSTLQGFSSPVIGALLDVQSLDYERIASTLNEKEISGLFLALKNALPDSFFIYKDAEGFYKDFHFIPLNGFEQIETRPDALTLIDDFYAGKDLQLRIRQHSGDLRKLIDNRIKRFRSKLSRLEIEYTTAIESDELKLKGELILANLYHIKKGMASIVLDNYYDQTTCEVILDPQRSPQENSQIYYKKYNKLKAARDHISSQKIQTEEEIQYLDSILEAISNSRDEENLELIKRELIEQGYMKKKGYRKEKKIVSKPHHFKSHAGLDIYVGKNNVQNDLLTFKSSSNSDLWFHAKNMPGSHTILSLKGQVPDEASLLLAAQLAAYFSKGKWSSNIPVDYTEVRHVKKPSGAKPGFVNYFHQRTLHVTPVEEDLMTYQQD